MAPSSTSPCLSFHSTAQIDRIVQVFRDRSNGRPIPNRLSFQVETIDHEKLQRILEEEGLLDALRYSGNTMVLGYLLI